MLNIAQHFALDEAPAASVPYGNGHIHDTYLVTGAQNTRSILQRFNSDVFRSPWEVMENIGRVCRHLEDKYREQGCGDIDRRRLTCIPAHGGKLLWEDEKGRLWRCFRYIEGTETREKITESSQAHKVANAFGVFQRLLEDLPGPPLHETIPQFHDTPARFRALLRALETDSQNRARRIQPELDFIQQREPDLSRLAELHQKGDIPLRITHNDTKINNILLDKKTGEGVCVIDLDTVMPGFSLHDFGDMVRSAAQTAAEDERDLDKIFINKTYFAELASGYLSAVRDMLTEAEKDNLVFSGKLLALELAIRFLTDYLEGDRYFKTRRADQNLDRCRCQLKFVRSLEENEQELQNIVAGI